MIPAVVALIKFLHVMSALALSAIVLQCCFLPAMSTKRHLLLQISLFAGITGTLLIYPRHFTVHTPWIQAAFLLLAAFMLAACYLWKWRIVISPLLFTMLVIIIHDAVTKTAF